ncbi:family 16 glycosylhydrolase [Bradyrhizobium sp. B120]|uniref:family 16 glycosylhydrolase n=1 Tax=Bradyrhizobium sp. B120 TaxID=3410088 RepID=UPI003B984218
MALAAPAGFTSSNLVYEENFSGTTLDSYWHPYITSRAANGWPWNSNGSGSGPGGPLDVDYDMPSQVTVNNGILDLTAIRQPVSGINGGTPQTFPVTSGAVSSYGKFEFDGGYLQISMKAPSGDGAWPGLWLLPGAGSSGGDNFEIDMQEGGYTGSGPANQAFAWHLHTPSGTVGGVIDTGIDLTAGFHTYGINWVPGKSITWYLDGKQMAQVTSAQVPIPNEPMELIMSNQVANSNAAGWHTAFDSSTPSTMQMQIDQIQLYQAAGGGDTVTGANVTPSTPTQPTTPPVQPAVTQATASPGTGTEHVGDTATFTLGFNEVVNVTGTPTLSLNDGSVATYVSGSGTSTLTFRTTVAPTDTATSALAITGVNLPGTASIKDASGVAASLAGAVKTFAGLQVDPTTATPPTQPTTPPIQPAVNQVAASPGTGIEHVGDTATFTLGFNESVNVTGTPTLSLNDGSTATYVSGSGSSTLTFRTTVASTDTATSALAITGVNLPGTASIKDASGVAANLAGAVKTFAGLQVDPTPVAPVLAIADTSLWVNGRGGTVDLGVKVTTADSNDAVTVNIQGLPKYETITDNLDGRTYKGSNITLTAAQVDSGLTLQSNYRGGGHPVATLTLTASGKDPTTGSVTTSTSQSITVTDPRPATTTHTASSADRSFALLNQCMAGHHGRGGQGQLVAADAQGGGWNEQSLLTKPHH